jgi:hypothetical protein
MDQKRNRTEENGLELPYWKGQTKTDGVLGISIDQGVSRYCPGTARGKKTSGDDETVDTMDPPLQQVLHHSSHTPLHSSFPVEWNAQRLFSACWVFSSGTVP